MISALRRKVKEEVGIDITNIEPRSFSEGFGVKKMPDGNDMPVHMIFLYFDCISHSEQIILHNGFEDFAWVMEHELSQYNLNPPTKSLFKQRGFL